MSAQRRSPLRIATAHRPQRGAALLMAMMIVAIIATLASSMLWQHWRSVQLEASERLREQADGVLEGALDFARMILREDAREDRRNGRQSDDLNENWATRLQPARISSFLAADVEQTDDAPDAFITGGITDAQSRYNLRNLAPAGKLVPEELKVLQRLCQAAGVRVDVADQLGDAMQRGMAALIPESAASAASAAANAGVSTSGPKDAPLLPESVDQLAWLGVDDASAAKLRPYVTLLPRRTPVNINTASSLVLGAVLSGPNADSSVADRLVNARKRKPFGKLADVATELGTSVPLDPQQLSVNSEFFEVRALITLEQRQIATMWLVNRRASEVTPIYRRRLDSLEAAALAAPPAPS